MMPPATIRTLPTVPAQTHAPTEPGFGVDRPPLAGWDPKKPPDHEMAAL
jgi:hypothetical protein